jgi:ribosomal-protein-alanine N-acetyltransferase
LLELVGSCYISSLFHLSAGGLTPTLLRSSALSSLRVKRAFWILDKFLKPSFVQQERVPERSNGRVSYLRQATPYLTLPPFAYFYPMAIITQTTRITIREFLLEELDTYLAHFNDEQLLLYIPKRTREQRINIFNTALSKYHESKTVGIWGMFNKADGTFIGSCLLRPYNDNLTILELGYSIERPLWGQGIASEMAGAMVAHAFADDSIAEIIAMTSLPNIASQRVLEKAGFKRIANQTREGEELACFSLSR